MAVGKRGSRVAEHDHDRRPHRYFALALSCCCARGVPDSTGTPRRRSGTFRTKSRGAAMRWYHAGFVMLLSATAASNIAAQATGMPSFNAPYRAFRRSEIGVVLSFPNGGGTAFEGAYRISSSKFDLGFRGGIFDPGGNGDALLLLGAEARERVV